MITLDFMSGTAEQEIRELLPRMKALTLEASSIKAGDMDIRIAKLEKDYP